MCSPVQDFKGAENPSGEKKPRCRVQVAWPLRRPGVDRPAAVSVSSFFSLMFSVPLFLHSIFFFYLLLPFPLFCSTDSVRITIYLHPQPLSLSRPPLYPAGRALLVLSADVVLLPVWAPERLVGHPSGRLGQGGAWPGAVRDVTAAAAEIHQCPSLLQETPASQVLPYLHISVIWIKLLDSLQLKLMTVINLAEHFSKFFHSCHAILLLNMSNLFAGQMEQSCSIFFFPKQLLYLISGNCMWNNFFKFKD